MDAEYPRVGLDLEQTGSGQETLSQYPNEPKSSWKLTQIGGERPDDDSKQLDVGVSLWQSYWSNFGRMMLSIYSPYKHQHLGFLSMLSLSSQEMLHCRRNIHFMSIPTSLRQSPNHSRSYKTRRMLLKQMDMSGADETASWMGYIYHACPEK